MASPVTDQTLSVLLGLGLTHKEWRLILSGEIFNDCIGGRYFTEWQHSLGCKSFWYTNDLKQRLVELEFEMFKDEIVLMVQEGYEFKKIARRLRGEVWRDDGAEERSMRLRNRRLFGEDARTKMFRSAFKKWKMEFAVAKNIEMLQNTKTAREPLQPITTNQYTATHQELQSPIWIPQTFALSQSSPAFRCSFSAITSQALHDKHLPAPPTSSVIRSQDEEHQSNLHQAILNLHLKTQQSKQELRAMKADLQSIKVGLQQHKKEIASLQGGAVQAPQPPQPATIIDEFEEILSRQGIERDERCRSRRRGRVFHCNKASTSPPQTSRYCSRIPVRTAPPKIDTVVHILQTEFVKEPDAHTWSRVPVLAGQEPVSDKVPGHRRAVAADRDSGYASPSSNFGSGDGMLDARTYVGVVKE